MPAKIRVAHVNVARGYRGGERQTELLIRELAKHEVDQVLVGRRGQPLIRRVDAQIEVVETNGDFLSVCAATRNVDIIHVHEGRSVYGAYLRSLLSRTPYVVTRRVDNPVRDHWFAHKAYRRASLIAVVSPAVAHVIERFDSRLPTVVVGDGSSALPVDVREVASIRARFPGKFIVGNVAVLENDQKGQEHILSVAKELQTLEPSVRFVLVGDGPDEAMLRRMAAGLSNVEFVGFRDNVGDYLAAFDLFVFPSNREGLGSILLDAMAQRVPVVASRVGGIPSIVTDEVTGLLIEPKRPDELQAAILRARHSSALRERLADAAFELAGRYTPEAMCRRYLELYERVLGRPVP